MESDCSVNRVGIVIPERGKKVKKVFLSQPLLGHLFKTKYVSDDYDLGDKEFDFPISYIASANIQEGDEVLFVSTFSNSKNRKDPSKESDEKLNCDTYRREITEICKEKNVEAKFEEISTEGKNENFETEIFNTMFQKIFDLIQDDDKVYMDLTFGLKPYTFSMFLAMMFAVRVSTNIHVEEIVYAQKYNGSGDRDVNISRLYDLSSIFYLGSIAGHIPNGNRASAKHLLNLLVEK